MKCERNKQNVGKRWDKKDTTVSSGIPVDTKNTDTETTTTIVVGAAAGIYDFYETNIGTIAKTVCDDIAFYLDKGIT